MTRKTIIAVSICLLLLFFSCAPKNPGPQHHIPPEPKHQPPVPVKIPAAQIQELSPARQMVIQLALENLGKPYQWGGQSPAQGFDCSGLVVFTHKSAGINVPRTTVRQFDWGNHIEKSNLIPADLVFFKHPSKSKSLHVGIYIGDNLFVHAPGKNRQVIYSDLNNTYFKNNYIGARRFTD